MQDFSLIFFSALFPSRPLIFLSKASLVLSCFFLIITWFAFKLSMSSLAVFSKGSSFVVLSSNLTRLPSIFLTGPSIGSSLFNFSRMPLRTPLRSFVSSRAVKTMSLSSSLHRRHVHGSLLKFPNYLRFLLSLLLEILLFRQQNYPRICFSF